MPNFIFAYHGGGKPESPEEGQKVMAAWMSWYETMGSAIADGGAPVGMSKTVTASGVEDNGGSNPLSGFTLVTADSIEAATELAKGCPILQDGGTVEVAEALQM
ncbi:MAG: YciI family protein [Cognatishimia sp.]|uniref:YciI family protein n=1 Tax=Cognatishimia sp. 1_MG-2023 TaxID=3062642 RepID=UPI0026E37BE2|nr:YciI family protein [Cognatishimia sp. 1_MG-2023]MDO6726973.1 YciI family protein [Cognatishimia sp. 1_MG-2023]